MFSWRSWRSPHIDEREEADVEAEAGDNGVGGDDSVKEKESSWEMGSGDYQEASKDEADSCSS